MRVHMIAGMLAVVMAANSSVAWATCAVPLTSSAGDLDGTAAASKLNGYFKCDPQNPANDLSPCNAFVGRAVDELYGLGDFKKGSGYMLANDMSEFLESGAKGWKEIGPLLNQENADCAQALANKGYAVVAALKASGHGHVALVLPGRSARSPTWGMDAPNSASFLLGNVSASYVGRPMSAAFGKENAKKAKYYYKKAAR